MSQNLKEGTLNRCVLNALAEPKHSSNPFRELSDPTALRAAALIVETAAFNLAAELPSEDIGELIRISHNLVEMVAKLEKTTPFLDS